MIVTEPQLILNPEIVNYACVIVSSLSKKRHYGTSKYYKTLISLKQKYMYV